MLPVFIAPPPLQAPWPVMHRVHVAAPPVHPVIVTKAAKPATKKPTWVPKTLPAPKKKAAAVSGTCGASCQWHRTDAVWAQFPASIEVFAKCVSHHESWSGHMWAAENPISTASGGFQFIDSTWRAWAARAGVSAPGHAAHAPPSTQAYVFAYGITHYGGRRAWHGTNCPGT